MFQKLAAQPAALDAVIEAAAVSAWRRPRVSRPTSSRPRHRRAIRTAARGRAQLRAGPQRRSHHRPEGRLDVRRDRDHPRQRQPGRSARADSSVGPRDQAGTLRRRRVAGRHRADAGGASVASPLPQARRVARCAAITPVAETLMPADDFTARVLSVVRTHSAGTGRHLRRRRRSWPARPGAARAVGNIMKRLRTAGRACASRHRGGRPARRLRRQRRR